MTPQPPSRIAATLAVLAASVGLLTGAWAQAAGPQAPGVADQRRCRLLGLRLSQQRADVSRSDHHPGRGAGPRGTATATGLDFENSQWVLKGQVRIRNGWRLAQLRRGARGLRRQPYRSRHHRRLPGLLRSRNSRIGDMARGRADDIEYDFDAGDRAAQTRGVAHRRQG